MIPNVDEIALLVSKNAAGQQCVIAHDRPDPTQAVGSEDP
jgi:hypothetical protein